jgi:hypothetical protein
MSGVAEPDKISTKNVRGTIIVSDEIGSSRAEEPLSSRPWLPELTHRRTQASGSDS